MIQDRLRRLQALENEQQILAGTPDEAQRRAEIAEERSALVAGCAELSSAERVFLARHPKRPKIEEYIEALFTDFFEQKGDRQCKEDASILGGIACYKGIPVTVLGHRKGANLADNMKYNFGMPGPEGYRKALRMMQQAEKFGRPVITFIDTPGAYPGVEAEARGQGEAIARNLAEMSRLTVPVISIVTGEGNSGGALAIGVANRILMLENAVYSVLSPEGFASILWKDASRHAEACDLMRLTAQDLYQAGIVDEIIPEPLGGAQLDKKALFSCVDIALEKNLSALRRQTRAALASGRYKKFREIGC